MPTVPTSFLPSVAPASGVDIGQFQAPQVAVAENLAAEQEARFGQAMTQAGNVAFRVGSAIQDDIDEAQTKETGSRGGGGRSLCLLMKKPVIPAKRCFSGALSRDPFCRRRNGSRIAASRLPG